MNVAIDCMIAVEPVIVSLSMIDICLHKKRRAVEVFFLLAILSASAIGISYLMLRHTPVFATGSGVFILLCLIFLFPAGFLYRERFSAFLTVLFSSGVYAMLVFSISVQIAKLFPAGYYPYLVLGIQSGSYAVSLYWIVRFLKQRFSYLLGHISHKINIYFQWVSIIWFLLIVVLNLTFSFSQALWMKIASLLILTVNLMFSYVFLYNLVKNLKDIKCLQEAVYVDEMTGLYNRSRMFLDAAQKIKGEIPFYLLYIDLNDFKSVNDSYGHLAGDNYLCRVADAVKGMIGEEGILYRMSGDEFISIYTGKNLAGCLAQLEEYPWDSVFKDVKFRGFSVGYCRFPDDSRELDELIFLADSRMYSQKRGDMGNFDEKREEL